MDNKKLPKNWRDKMKENEKRWEEFADNLKWLAVNVPGYSEGVPMDRMEEDGGKLIQRPEDLDEEFVRARREMQRILKERENEDGRGETENQDAFREKLDHTQKIIDDEYR